MTDPFAEVVALLQPGALRSKIVCGAGAWQIKRTEAGLPFYCVILEGGGHLTMGDAAPIPLQQGDFILIPAARSFSFASLAPLPPGQPSPSAVVLSDGTVRLGQQTGPLDYRALVGHFDFGSPDATLLVSLLPDQILVRGQARLATLVQLVAEESRRTLPARDMILSRLLEVLMLESLRATTSTTASPGLLRGLGDERIAAVLRQIHETPTRDWSVVQLASAAGLSRSAFFARFTAAVGMTPMEYLLTWRMALAKNLLRRREGGVAQIAARVGYGSASAFTTAFTRHVGTPPTQYARDEESPATAPILDNP